MHILWDHVPRWRKEANDRVGKKSASEASETRDKWRFFPPQSPDRLARGFPRLALAPLLETLRFQDENRYQYEN